MFHSASVVRLDESEQIRQQVALMQELFYLAIPLPLGIYLYNFIEKFFVNNKFCFKNTDDTVIVKKSLKKMITLSLIKK